MIGGWGNTRSAVNKKRRGNVLIEETTPNILSGDELKKVDIEITKCEFRDQQREESFELLFIYFRWRNSR